MVAKTVRACGWWIGLLGVFLGELGASEPVVPPDHAQRMQRGVDLFKSDIRGLFERHCLDCHGGRSTKADFDLSSREALLESGNVEPKAVASRLYRVVAHLDEPHMPHKAPRLPQGAIDQLARWIELGAPYDRPLIDRPSARGERPAMQITADDRAYWAFRPLRSISLPEVRRGDWVRTPIDRFILAAQEQAGVEPAPDASRVTWLRRLSFDLVGLPPEPELVRAWVDGRVSEEAIIDQLLDSPHYGERWGRHWLDPARFAESHGFEHDYSRNHAYHYRDYVIRAWNRDQPFDEFLRWQLAGDELAPDDPDALAATGFLGAGVFPTQITTREAERVRYDALDDMLATTGHAMLGLTIGCARCHDHKFDPIPTRDYYQLLSAFTTTVRSEVDWDFGTPTEQAAMRAFEGRLKPLIDERDRYERDDLAGRCEAWLAAVARGDEPRPEIADAALKEIIEKLVSGQTMWKQLDKPGQKRVLDWFKPRDAGWQERLKPIATLEKVRPRETRSKIQVCTEGMPPMRHHTAERSIPDFYEQTHLLARGDVAQKQEVMSLGFLQVLMPTSDAAPRWQQAPPPGARTSWRRASLARWLTDAESGAGMLAARVIVNRLWHHHFGRGVVATINDFGVQGDPPSHPELLEWLAHDLVANGWQIKRLQRLIVSSHVYRLGGERSPENARLDPDNRLFWHRPRRRLEAEIIRDHALAVSGQLDRSLFGPGTLNEGSPRRSIYLTVKRANLVPMLQVFDWPDSLTSGAARPTTVVAPQALLFLNNPHVRRWCDAWGKQLASIANADPAVGIERAYLQAFGRSPTPAERQAGEAFLAEQLAIPQRSADRAWADYAHVLVSLNEFIYID